MEVVNLTLNKKDLEVILESLCFTACVDVNHPLYQEDIEHATDLAINLRKQHRDIVLSTAFISTKDSSQFMGYNTPKLIQYFPELLENA
jgi:hypothetical protein